MSKNSSLKVLKKKDSSTAPLMIPCICTPRTLSQQSYISDPQQMSNPLKQPDADIKLNLANEVVYKLLYKFEDIRKDQIVMDIIRLSSIILTKEGSPQVKKCRLLSYNVLPTAIESGMIEMVQSSVTFYDIDNKYSQAGVWQYLVNENLNSMKPIEVYETFLCSAAAYSVVSLLLNVGDRHLDNIMVTSRGEFFHIDYGFILGEEPVIKQVMPKNLIRLPRTMTELLQTVPKDKIKLDFKDLTAEIYTILRRHYIMFMNLLILLDLSQPKIPFQFNLKYIEEEIHARFLPGTSDAEAREIFLKAISQPEGIMTIFTDFGHHAKRQRAFDRFRLTATSTFNRMFSLILGAEELNEC